MNIPLYNNLSKEKKMSFWVIIASLIQKGLSILATPIFTRLLTSEEYSQATLYDAWFSILLVFASLQIYDYATMAGMVHFKKDYKCFVAAGQVTMLVCTLIVSIVLTVVNEKTEWINFPTMIVGCLFIDMLTYSAYNLWITKKQCLFEYRPIAAVSIAMGVLSFALQMAFVLFMRDKMYSKIYGLVAAHVLIGLLLLVQNLRGIRIRKVVGYFKYLFAISLPIIPHLLASQILMRADRLMIGSICGDALAGVYSVAYSLAMLTMIVNDAVLKAFIPWEYDKIKNEKTGQIAGVTNKLTIAMVAVNVVVMLLAPELIRFFAPAEYYAAIYVIPPVSASVFIMFVFNLYVNIEYYYGKTKFISVASTGAAVLNIVLNAVFIPQYGFVAAGYTTLASYCVYTLGHYLFSNKIVLEMTGENKIYSNRKILLMSTFTVAMAIFISVLYQYSKLRYGLIAVVLVIAFILRKRIISMLKEIV